MEIKKSDLIIVPGWCIAVIGGHLIMNFGFEGVGQLLLRTVISAALMGGCAVTMKRMQSFDSSNYGRDLLHSLVILSLTLPAVTLGIGAIFASNASIPETIGYGVLGGAALTCSALIIGAIGGLIAGLARFAWKRCS